MKAVLNSSGIDATIIGENVSHIYPQAFYALNPNGIRLIVSADDIDQAREILKLPEPQEPAPKKEYTPDQCAQRAFWSCFLSWWFFPIAFLTIYWLVRAKQSRQISPVQYINRYRVKVLVAFTIGVILPAIILSAFILDRHGSQLLRAVPKIERLIYK